MDTTAACAAAAALDFRAMTKLVASGGKKRRFTKMVHRSLTNVLAKEVESRHARIIDIPVLHTAAYFA